MSDIPCPLAGAAREHGDREALISGRTRLSYAEYNRRVGAAAGWLRENGVGTGHRVGLVAPNGIEYPIVLMALVRLRAVACLLGTRFPAGILASLIRSTGCRHLVVGAASSAPDDVTGANTMYLGEMPSLAKIGGGDATPDAWNPDVDSTIVCTSGTTADPKAVLHSLGSHYFNALGANEVIPLSRGHRWLVVLPFYHVGGLAVVFRCLLAGAALVVGDNSQDLDSTMRGYNITHISVVGTQLLRLVQSGRRFDRAGRRPVVLLGGGTVSSHLVRKADEAGLSVYTTYGLTEMASQVTAGEAVISTPEGSRYRPPGSGQVLKHRELAIAPDGEILVRGETLCRGYVEGEAVVDRTDHRGWFHTGDTGFLDDREHLHVTGRLDNLIISGGENMHPEAVEAVLTETEGVAQAVVVGVADEEYGQRPVAFIKTRGDAQISPEALSDSLRQRLPGFMVPVAWFDMPKQAYRNKLKPDRQFLSSLAQRLYRPPAR